MKSRAAVAFEAGKPLEIAEVDVGGPAAGEVMVEIKATGATPMPLPSQVTILRARSRRSSATKAPALLWKWVKG